MIKIISGWSDKGGSTFAFIRLTNALNKAGYDTIFYGPHPWHLNKCKSGLLKDFKPQPHDTLIVHFMNIPKLDVKKIILSCHEKNLFEVGKIPQFWDEAVFLNMKHRKYHTTYYGKFSIIPNLKEELVKNEKTVSDVAGIIGSIDRNKNTHISIERALAAGFEKIILFGNVTDQPYFDESVKPLLNDNITLYGFIEDKQKMYDMVSDVFLSSSSEVASLVKDECETTGTIFHGNFATTHDGEKLSNEEILEKWVKVLEV